MSCSGSIATPGNAESSHLRNQFGERQRIRLRLRGLRIAGILIQVRHDHEFDARFLLDALHCIHQRVLGDDGAHAGIRCNPRDLGRSVDRINIRHDRAETKDREKTHGILRAVLQHDARAIAPADAQPVQRPGQPVHALFDIPER